MPERTRAHELETLSRIQLHDIFSKAGWVCGDIQPDYGEDLLVRIFANKKPTPYSFFVQAKATDHIERYVNKSGKGLDFPIKTDHIEHWKQFAEPVILTVWDAKSDITYWESIQKILERSKVTTTEKKRIAIHIPTDNILNEEGIKRIARHTKARFSRFERERESKEMLSNFAKGELNLEELECDSQHGILYTRKPNEKLKLTLFGANNPLVWMMGQITQDQIDEMQKRIGFMAEQLFQEYKETGQVNLRDFDGNIVRTFATIEEFANVLNEAYEEFAFSNEQTTLNNTENKVIELTLGNLAED